MCICIYILYTYRYIVACPNAAEPFEVVEEGSAPPPESGQEKAACKAAQGKSMDKQRTEPATKRTYATEVCSRKKKRPKDLCYRGMFSKFLSIVFL
jgi:hypothetical protein